MPKPKRSKRTRPTAAGQVADRLPAAIELHRAGKFSQAERAYKRILEGPCDVALLQHLLGRLYWQTQRQPEAIESLGRALAARENYAEALLDLANMLSELGQLEQAREHLQQLIQWTPRAALPRKNLGLVLEELKEFQAALDAYRSALDLESEDAVSWSRWARVQTQLGALEAAASGYRRAVDIDPSLVDAWRCLASLWRRLDRQAEAREALTAWLRLEPDNPVPQHLLSAYDVGHVPSRASDQYVRQVFDQFAVSFETDLQRLDYRGPQLIQEALLRELGGVQSAGDVLDAGCGTGLCGPVLRPYARRLIGVDLSPKMLALAEQRRLYDEVVAAELCSYLGQRQAGFDVIACADTFGYFGDLAPLLAALRGALRPGGRLIATVEIGQVLHGPGYLLHASGRYTHDVDYVLQSCHAAGLTVRDQTQAALRMEAEVPVAALILTAAVLL